MQGERLICATVDIHLCISILPSITSSCTEVREIHRRGKKRGRGEGGRGARGEGGMEGVGGGGGGGGGGEMMGGERGKGRLVEYYHGQLGCIV